MFKSKKLFYVLLIFLSLSLVLSPISSADWPMFQKSPDHIGYVDEPSDFVNNLWTINLGSNTNSTPIVKDDSLYAISSDGVLHSIDLKNGTVNWTYKFSNSISASPVIKGDILYVGDLNGNFYAFNTSSKTLKWTFSNPKPIESSAVVDKTMFM